MSVDEAKSFVNVFLEDEHGCGQGDTSVGKVVSYANCKLTYGVGIRLELEAFVLFKLELEFFQVHGFILGRRGMRPDMGREPGRMVMFPGSLTFPVKEIDRLVSSLARGDIFFIRLNIG